ncbi:MAG: TerC family protein [Alphaproteobacteria bacterium]|nr:TerC family protein [Alphaproteobacteria bacterium]
MTFDPAFWTALGQIIGINIILSGDNAVVIALACRNLPERYRNKAIVAGSAGAIILRIIFSVFVVELMSFPWLKLIGGVLLLWIGVKLIVPEGEHGDGIEGSGSLWGAIRTVVIADAVMSLDNVIAIAAAARGSFTLLVVGLAISIPLIIVGSQLILKILIKYPILVIAGGGLLGWIAGEVIAGDPALEPWVDANAAWLHFWAKPIGAVVVIAIGKTIAWRRASGAPVHEVEDLSEGERK